MEDPEVMTDIQAKHQARCKPGRIFNFLQKKKHRINPSNPVIEEYLQRYSEYL